MVDKKILEKFPLKRLKPVDGMAVTAQLWEESHEYHRFQQRYHDLLRHGSGIVTGLEVVASDPPNSTIYVRPGLAVDSNGELIVVQEPVPYDFSPAQGLLYLVLSYSESRPEQEANGGPLYVRSQYGLEAVTELPTTPYLELARVHRTRPGAITDPASPDFPLENEIDQRYRNNLGPENGSDRQTISIAVCYTGRLEEAVSGHGSGSLAHALNRSGLRVVVDVGVQLLSDLKPYTLVYLVGQAGAGLNREQMNAIYAYLRSGGTVFMESCRRDSIEDAQASDAVFNELATSFGITLEEILPNHPLLTEPHLFGAPPQGFETEGSPHLLVGEGLILSTFDYGCLWQAQRRGRPASREEIRSAMEWGENLVLFAAGRKREDSD